MRILAAFLVDGENISPRYASDLVEIIHQEQDAGVVYVANVLIGNPQALAVWAGVNRGLHFVLQSHPGGKNAADHLLQEEALRLARQGIQRFYLVSNDKGFASTISVLRQQGSQVIGFGNAHAARVLRDSCDRFFVLGTDPSEIRAAMRAFSRQTSPHHVQGVAMSSFSPFDELSPSDLTRTQEALKTIYGSASQPPLLTNVLDLYLQHTMTALCLREEECDTDEEWTAGQDAEVLSKALHDPLIELILERDSHLNTIWRAVVGFASRCEDAYEQGRTQARRVFPHFPRYRLMTLHRRHLASLLSTWRSHPWRADLTGQYFYPGYDPDLEQEILLRWFRRGYLMGAREEPEERALEKRER